MTTTNDSPSDCKREEVVVNGVTQIFFTIDGVKYKVSKVSNGPKSPPVNKYPDCKPVTPKRHPLKPNRPVLQFSLDGKYITRYESSKEASAATGLGLTSVRASCNGAREYAGNFIFKYEVRYMKELADERVKQELASIRQKVSLKH